MITGSHNPPNENGFKICLGQTTIFGEQIQELREIIEKGDYVTGKGEKTPGGIEKQVYQGSPENPETPG